MSMTTPHGGPREAMTAGTVRTFFIAAITPRVSLPTGCPKSHETGRVTPVSSTTDRSRTALLALEVTTAVAALVGGTLFVLAPDGSLLMADPAVLAGTPFADWLIPGVLLALLVGGGFLAAGVALWWGVRGARELSVAAGIGLVLFEAVELAWISPHPLQAVFGVVGAAVVVLAVRRGVDDAAPDALDLRHVPVHLERARS